MRLTCAALCLLLTGVPAWAGHHNGQANAVNVNVAVNGNGGYGAQAQAAYAQRQQVLFVPAQSNYCGAQAQNFGAAVNVNVQSQRRGFFGGAGLFNRGRSQNAVRVNVFSR